MSDLIPVDDRIKEKYDVIEETGCWKWTAAIYNKTKFPYITVRSAPGKFKKMVVPRYLYQQKYGEIRRNQVIQITCGEPRCVNPEHMEAIDRSVLNAKSNPKVDLKKRISNYIINDETQCWEWQGFINPDGYGVLGATGETKGRSQLAHRIAYEEWVGEIPPGMSVCHRCDNPKCINPAHLFAGSHLDNMKDRDIKGRQAKGSQSGKSKLTEAQVEDILRRGLSGESSRGSLANEYKVTHDTISRILRREIWKHVEIPKEV